MIEQIRLPFPGKSLPDQDEDILLTSLIFLRARDDIPQARVGVGCVARNRVNNVSSWWGQGYRKVITNLLDFYRLSEQEKNLVMNPIKNNVNDKWDECYLIATKIIDNTIPDNTYNSDYFFLTSDKKFNPSLISSWYVCTHGNIRFYRIELVEKRKGF